MRCCGEKKEEQGKPAAAAEAERRGCWHGAVVRVCVEEEM